MKRFSLLLVMALSLTCLLAPGIVSAQSSGGFSVTCDDGTSFDNGVEIIVNQMRSGYTYTATAIGLNGFDPVLAVLDTSTGEGLCSDDASGARRYAANLPTTGYVPASTLSAQVNFAQNSRSTFADVSLVVGGYGNQTGEFVLILEGMAVTSGDGAGDVFSVSTTPGMIASGVPLSVYMITRGQSGVDPLMYVAADADFNVMTDSSDNLIYCDDAGNPDACYTPDDITNSSVTIATGNLTTWSKDAVLELDISNYQDDYLNYVMTSYRQESEGQYLLAFHMGITDAIPSNGGRNSQTGNGGNTGGSSGGNSGGNSGTNTGGSTGGTTGGSEQRGG